MNFKDYIEVTKENIKEYMEEQWVYLKDKSSEELYDEFFISDYITGNASGSYTFSTYDAEQNVSELIWDEEFRDELKFNFGESLEDLLGRGAEAVDVTARCLALSYIDIDSIKESIEEEKEEDDE